MRDPRPLTGSIWWSRSAWLACVAIIAGQGFSRFSFGLLFPRMSHNLVGGVSG